MYKRNLEVEATMQDSGEYEITVRELESGYFTKIGPYKAKSMYSEDVSLLEDIREEIIGWLILMDEERECVANEE